MNRIRINVTSGRTCARARALHHLRTSTSSDCCNPSTSKNRTFNFLVCTPRRALRRDNAPSLSSLSCPTGVPLVIGKDNGLMGETQCIPMMTTEANNVKHKVRVQRMRIFSFKMLVSIYRFPPVPSLLLALSRHRFRSCSAFKFG